MPTENEELDLLSGDVTDNTNNTPLDVTEFVDTNNNLIEVKVYVDGEDRTFRV